MRAEGFSGYHRLSMAEGIGATMVRPRTVAMMLLILLPAIASPARADQWGSSILANCYALGDRNYKEHFFVRVFWTELGGRQLDSENPGADGPLALHNLHLSPVSCDVDGRKVAFETIDYRQPTIRGACGQCEQTGFRLTLDGKAIWEAPRPEPRGTPIFNGTIDVDRDMARICTEHRPADLGVELPYKPDFFASKTSILVCETISLPPN